MSEVIHVLAGEPYDVYIGRAMPRYGLPESVWANPYKIGRDGSRAEVLRLYEDWVRRERGHQRIRAALGGIPGEVVLACWCAPKDGTALTLEDEEICHGQVLLRLVEELHAR